VCLCVRVYVTCSNDMTYRAGAIMTLWLGRNVFIIVIIIIFTLGINDPEGFWKKLSKIRKC